MPWGLEKHIGRSVRYTGVHWGLLKTQECKTKERSSLFSYPFPFANCNGLFYPLLKGAAREQ